jgi:hypothetical protein
MAEARRRNEHAGPHSFQSEKFAQSLPFRRVAVTCRDESQFESKE